jgi:tRNA nucleotidyltransferase/poly(A) polymerase
MDKKITKDDIPPPIISILQRIQQHGFKAYIVGGAIRDILINRIPVEFDLACDAHPEELMTLFTIANDNGATYGTLGILWDTHVVEITTFRKDVNYTNFRHPGEVIFSNNIHDDLIRRDFTINAMAFDPLTNEFIDDYSGLHHLNNRQLVCIGDSYQRFTEDSLRPFRCFRFMAQLGFTLHRNIVGALHDLSEELPHPSISRIRHEMDRLLLGRFWKSAIKSMTDTGWLNRIVPAPPTDTTEIPNDKLFRWAWLFSNSPLTEIASTFQFSKTAIRQMKTILEWKYNETAVRLCIKDLAISSDELIRMGYQGKQLGDVQQELLRKVRLNEIINESSNLKKIAQAFLNKQL